MSEQKPKKTFLKKGTRQFLSNATVRSLSQKPKIIEYTQDGQQIHNNNQFVYNTIKNQFKQQFVIAVKPKNSSRDKPQSASINVKQNAKKTNNLNDKTKDNKNETNLQENIQVNTKANSNSNSLSKGSQKKPTLLTDYLNNDSKSSKKSVLQNIPPPISKSIPTKSIHQPISQSQAHHLKMQDIDDDSDEDNFDEYNKNQDEGVDVNQFLTKKEKVQSSPQQIKKVDNKKKPNLLQQVFGSKKQKQNSNFNIQSQKVEQKSQQNEVNFQSDSDDDEKQKKNQFKSKGNKNAHNNRFKQNINQNDEARNSDSELQNIDRKATLKLGTKPQSKVTQMFNHNANQKTNTQVANQQQALKSKKMTIDDVPKQLIEQIVQKYFKDAKAKSDKKYQSLVDNIKIIQKKAQAVADQQKALQKRIKQFDKVMQQKNKQFENKIKSQQNKITRQKMYLKDQQTTGKVDWKTKNQIQQLKQQLQEQRTKRQKIQVKLKAQLDRVKTKLNQQQEAKKNLQIRIGEYEKNKIQAQKQIKQQEKRIRQETMQLQRTFWQDAPKNTRLERFYENNFSLSEFSLNDYFYQNNEFYKYYKLKGNNDYLQAQQLQGNKIKRTYENGKIQIQSPKKFVKEIFPWGYIIVHYINGDVKQMIQIEKDNNKKLQIYYAYSNKIIQYSICDGKNIHYFLNQDQIQLKDQFLQLRQVYTGNQLQRTVQKNVKLLQKNARGNFVQMY